MEATKTYSMKKSSANQGYYMGAFMLVAGIIALITINKLILMFFIFGVLMLVMAGLNSNHKVVKIFPKHFELKKGVAGSSKLIKNENLNAYEIKGKTMHINYTTENGDQKTFKLHQNALEKEDYTDFQKHLNSLITV